MSRDKIDSVTPDLASFNLIGAKILIVDDIPANLNVLYDTLAKENYEVLAAPSGEIALKNAQRANPDLILLDIVMPDINGYEVCRRLKQNQATADIPVIFITVREEKESLSKAFGAGGVDYITKPFEKEELLLRVETHLRISQLTKALLQKNHELQKEISRREQAEHAKVEAEEALLTADEQLSLISQREVQRWGITGFVGKSQTVRKTLEEIHRLHKNETINVLITGESGTGKELVARAIHFGGSRAKGPFIPVLSIVLRFRWNWRSRHSLDTFAVPLPEPIPTAKVILNWLVEAPFSLMKLETCRFNYRQNCCVCLRMDV